jgi:hypothetical protein
VENKRCFLLFPVFSIYRKIRKSYEKEMQTLGKNKNCNPHALIEKRVFGGVGTKNEQKES